VRKNGENGKNGSYAALTPSGWWVVGGFRWLGVAIGWCCRFTLPHWPIVVAIVMLSRCFGNIVTYVGLKKY